MIVVIADDFTGAAEIGGLGLKYDLTVEIITSANTTSNADLLIISTDTRSIPEKQAIDKIASLTEFINRLKPDLIFKKIDSVLRGHVMAEVKTHLNQLGLERALLVPANPAFGRTLINSKYFINGTPIHQTSFAVDPEFPVVSAHIHEMLRTNDSEIHIAAPSNEMPELGIIVGECANVADLKLWANKDLNNTLLGGSAAFFSELLGALKLKRSKKKAAQTEKNEEMSLFVCGSTHDTSRQLVKKVSEANGPISYMPMGIIGEAEPSDRLFEDWLDEILYLLEKHKRAIVAVDENTASDKTINAASLRTKKATVIEKVFKRTAIKELLIEGGSTAAAIINCLNFNRFFPVAEPGPGVIKMKVDTIDNLFLTVKPGSYKWPADTWNF